MITVLSPDHEGHRGACEFQEGALLDSHETPDRHDRIEAALASRGIGTFAEATDFGIEPILRVHDEGYVRFLASAWDDWSALGRAHPALAGAWRGKGMPGRVPDCVDGRLGHYANDACCPVVAGTWKAALGSAHAALTAVDLVRAGERSAFALCRPPGHHAHPGAMGGYCYLNNAAVAAQAFIDGGAARVAVLDVDYHHGNGTQDIFWHRGDVLTASLHADPAVEYPYFLGHADETGAGPGEGANANVPLPHGTDAGGWLEALGHLRRRIASFGPDAVVCALGTDTYEADPISRFKLRGEDFLQAGKALSGIACPVVFVMEGGYAVEALGTNVANVLEGFLRG